jgi:hypothetical protein
VTDGNIYVCLQPPSLLEGKRVCVSVWCLYWHYSIHILYVGYVGTLRATKMKPSGLSKSASRVTFVYSWRRNCNNSILPFCLFCCNFPPASLKQQDWSHVDLNTNNSTFCPHSVFMCFVWISEQTAIISVYSINWLVFYNRDGEFTARYELWAYFSVYPTGVIDYLSSNSFNKWF